MASSDMGSLNFALISSYSFRRATTSRTPSSTTSRTVASAGSGGSCSRKPTV